MSVLLPPTSVERERASSSYYARGYVLGWMITCWTYCFLRSRYCRCN